MAVLYDVSHVPANAKTGSDGRLQSFNEELDKVFYEITLPEDDAWYAVAEDLRETKRIKQTLEGENK